MPHATSYQPSSRESILLSHKLDITPLREPLFPLPAKCNISPTDYLVPHALPFGRHVAEWQQEIFQLPNSGLTYREEPLIKPIRPDAPTLVAIFYPDDEPEERRRRSTENYLARIARLAALGEQTIIYVPPSISQHIRALRDDTHWTVIDEYETIWDIPNNWHQKHNFTHVQPALFADFVKQPGVLGYEPEPAYNHPHRSAVYNAKAFVSYDAVMRNPFGSERWMYVDAGILDEFGPLGADGRIWGDVVAAELSTAKFDRSIAVSRDSGVVFAEYMQSLAYGDKDINHAGWTDPARSWMCQHFMAQAYVGSSLGMLNYSVRFMQTVDDMDANGFYTAREEFIVPQVALRYPNTIFAIPWMILEWGKWEHPIKGCYTTHGGEESVPCIVDPLDGMCKGYQGRSSGLDGTGIYSWPRWKKISVFGQRYY